MIKTLSSNGRFNDPLLNKVLQRLRSMMYYFSSHSFYHILHGINKEAGENANDGCLLNQGVLSVNEEEACWAPIPWLG